MVVRIRLARFGKRNNPFYNIVVAQSKSGRNKKPLEVLGTYDPIPKEPIPGIYPYAAPPQSIPPPLSSPTSIPEPQAPQSTRKYKDIRLDTARTKYWLGVGAQPSEPVWKLLSMLGLVERAFGEDEMREKARRADERHREYWAQRGLAADGVTPLGKEATKASAEV